MLNFFSGFPGNSSDRVFTSSAYYSLAYSRFLPKSHFNTQFSAKYNFKVGSKTAFQVSFAFERCSQNQTPLSLYGEFGRIRKNSTRREYAWVLSVVYPRFCGRRTQVRGGFGVDEAATQQTVATPLLTHPCNIVDDDWFFRRGCYAVAVVLQLRS